MQTVVQLQGIVPNEELLTLLPFIDDIEYALELLEEEKEKNIDASYGMFELGGTTNVSESNNQTDNFNQ